MTTQLTFKSLHFAHRYKKNYTPLTIIMRVAIITGTAGQDGSYLAEFLLNKDYSVVGMVRRSSSLTSLGRLENARKHPRLELIYGDVTDITTIFRLLHRAIDLTTPEETHPIEIYNLAAQSHVKVSFDTPIYTAQSDAMGVLNLLEAVRQLGLVQRVRIYQASTSELYGGSAPPQGEDTPFIPRSPYAVAKLYAFHIIKNYREAYGMYAVNGILFNHESERRGETFVSRKITRAVAAVHHNKDAPILKMGNMYAYRDWGHAEDYIDAMWRMLQQPIADDFVIATGESHTVKEFIEVAFGEIGVRLRWEGVGVEEKGYNSTTNALLVCVDPKYFRQTEVNHLRGDPSHAKNILGWTPRVAFSDLVKRMVQYDIQCQTTCL